MGYHKDLSPNKQVRNLLAVIGSAVLLAFAASLLMLYIYSPTGRYIVKNALLSPDTMNRLAYSDLNSKAGGSTRFVFDAIEFSFFDQDLKKWQKVFVGNDAYSNFYDLIAEEKSTLDVTDEMVNAFSVPYPSTLTLRVKTENTASWQAFTKIFQEVQFAKQGGLYRIALHQQDASQRWIYFNHPDIYQIAMNNFSVLK